MPEKHQLKDPEYHLSTRAIKKIVHAAANFRDRYILKTFAQTAMRRFELAALDIGDVGFERRFLYIREGKGSKARTIPVSEDLLGDLRHLLAKRKRVPVFPNPRGEKLSVRQINKIVATAGKLAGVENPNPKYKNITCHLFRHSFAREWKKQGGPTESLSEILGHTSVKTTLDEYGTEDLEEVQENYERMMAEMF